MTRVRSLALTGLLAACSSNGTVILVASQDAGDDRTTATDAASDDAGSASPSDDGAADDAGPLCTDDAPEGGSAPSDDCVRVGHCPQNCLKGAGTAYACAATDLALGAYPGVFRLRADPFDVIGYSETAYPWEGGAYVACAAEACVRWSMADHIEGGSLWPSDPCANDDGGTATQAWACPSYQGFEPPPQGCVNAGRGQQIGGPGTGVDVNVVWCCPPAGTGGAADGGPAPDGGPGEGGAAESGAGDDASADGGAAAGDGSDAAPH
jgi:hypothetical protein